MTTLEQIKMKTRELQQGHASGVHLQSVQDEIHHLYERYRAERADVAPLEKRAAPPGGQAAPPKQHWRQRRKELDAGAPRKRSPRKLTDEQVLEIRQRWAAEGGRHGLQAQMAREYAVGKVTMGDIVHGRSFRHLL
jgi:hypothetical protein